MPTFQSAIDRDANRQIISQPLPFLAKKTMVFNGATLDDPGDVDGAGNPATLFNITGDVLVQILGIVKTTVVSVGDDGTISLGSSEDSVGLINGILVDTSNLVIKKVFAIDSGATTSYITNGLVTNYIISSSNIIQTVGVDNITEGEIDYYCFWRPLSPDGEVVAA